MTTEPLIDDKLAQRLIAAIEKQVAMNERQTRVLERLADEVGAQSNLISQLVTVLTEPRDRTLQ